MIQYQENARTNRQTGPIEEDIFIIIDIINT